MSLFSDYISESHVLASVPIKTPKHLFEYLSNLLSDENIGLSDNLLLERFYEREKIGSTVLSHGVFLPRCKVDFIETPVIAIITLQDPLVLADGDKIDIVVAMAFPIEPNETQSCCDVLTSVIDYFSDKTQLAAIRSANSNQGLYTLLV